VTLLSQEALTACAADDRKAAAMAYAQTGWKVFPLEGKTPLIADWPNRASDDPEQVRQWWEKFPKANIGFVPGLAGLVVMDIDGPGGDAVATNLGLLAEPTLSVKTSRGEHLYFKHPGGRIGNDKLGNGLDVRGDSGYVVLPPSVHESGAIYTWQSLDVAADPLPLPPKAKADLQRRQEGAAQPGLRPSRSGANGRGQVPRGIAGTTARVDTSVEGPAIHEGKRDDTIRDIACSLRGKGWEEPAIRDRLRAINTRRCVPPLPQSVVDEKARRVVRVIQPNGPVRRGTLLRDQGRPRERSLLRDIRGQAKGAGNER